MAQQRDGRAARIGVLIVGVVLAALVAVFFLVPRSPPTPPPPGRGQPTVCRLTRGQETLTRLMVNAAPVPAAAGDVVRCSVAPSFREHLEVWAQPGDAEAVLISSQPVEGLVELPGLEVPEGRTRIHLVRSPQPPTPEAVKEVLREGGRTPRLRVETYAIEAR